jgi:hypothetical protein
MRTTRVIAVHEAGHAVVGRALGLSCGGAHIDPDNEKGSAATKNPYLLAHDLVAAGRPRLAPTHGRAALGRYQRQPIHNYLN